MSKKTEAIPQATFVIDGDKVSNHPAYGMASVNRVRSSGMTLFASDLNHQEVIQMQIFEGQMLDRDGVRNPRRAARRPMVEVHFSSAQWATLVSSFGLGDGVPCTITRKTVGETITPPPIAVTETTRERFERDIEEAASRQLERLRECLGELSKLVAKGKAGKRELEALYSSMSSQLGNLPKNLSFTTTLIQESMDNIVAAGKAELEAVAVGTALRLGIKEIGRLASFEDPKNGD